MSYHGDIALGATIDIGFTTKYGGALASLIGGTAAAYADNGTTAITSGVTLSADNTVAGSHNVRIVATSGNTFAAGNYVVTLTAGTVGGISAIGSVVGSFSIDCRTAALLNAASAAPIASNVKKINGTTVNGDGGATPWGP